MEVHCEICGDPFPAAERSAGGIVNCPWCGKATSIPGLRDPIWRLVQAGVVVLAALAFAVGWMEISPVAGVTSGAGVLALGWLVTRAL